MKSSGVTKRREGFPSAFCSPRGAGPAEPGPWGKCFYNGNCNSLS